MTFRSTARKGIAGLTALLCLFLMTAPSGSVFAAASLTLTITTSNSWEENGKTRTQCSAAIQNSGSSSVSGWTIVIAVPEGATMGSGDGWNGTFTIKDNVLTITPAAYNSTIAGGSSVTDIGFILTSTGAVSLTGKVTADGSTGSSTPSSTAAPAATSSRDASQSTAGTSSSAGGTKETAGSFSGARDDDDWLHAEGGKLVDASGTEVWLTGVNWFGYNTGSNIFDGVWACNMRDAIRSIADHGFNLLRIPISAQLLLQWKSGVYPTANYNQALNPELDGLNSLEILDLAIKTCKENGIKVMFDIHSAETDSMGHMKNLWYTNTIDTEDYYDALTFLAARFAKDDTVLAIDLKNEPHGKPGEQGAIWNDSDSPNNWKKVAEEAGGRILDINPHLLIVVEGIEIYPKDLSTNGDFSSTNAADYYFNWWGGNLRGVKDAPVDLGSADRNKQLVYSPHDYGPAVYAQPWFSEGFTYDSLIRDCWQDNWLYIQKDGIAPILIGEWGGYMTEPNLTWMTDLRKLISDYRIHFTFWCFNANSGDTGGLVKDDFTTWDEEKYAFVKEVLWQKDGKFVGLDHVIPLGANGIALPSAIPASTSTTPAASSAETSAESSDSAQSDPSARPSPTPAGDAATNPAGLPLETAFAGAGLLLAVALAAGVGLGVRRRRSRRKDEDS